MGKMKIATLPKMGKITKPKTSNAAPGKLKIESGFKGGDTKKAMKK